ncbi:hypothetical protein GIB67_027774 [Kingdonia uniflora]|uniref:BTB domain-containing protein n=1 Tax=Kingdonia uniflora TaxID=39325 RepID=A0A7J7PD37_9MAGN|nr:hypothetical protein GIB67_027774 [Kingdonia uniflora]
MDLYSLRPLPVPDVRIITSAGITIPAHSSILGAGSLVLENILESRPRKGMGSEKIIHILGVPCDSVVAFLRFLYSFRCSEEEIHEFGVHLLVLSHFFSVPKLKERCRIGLDQRLTIENVVDVLQISKLCDAPDLYLKCMKLVMEEFKGVEMTEGWRFIQNHDPRLELEILQFINDSELRLKQRRKQIAEKSLYLQLSEAMDCLQHIFTEGCIHVGPYDKDPIKKKFPCKNYSTCQGLQQLICHFATCKKKVNGGCSQCKRMWQILRLHSSTCDQSDSCNVPLCR